MNADEPENTNDGVGELGNIEIEQSERGSSAGEIRRRRWQRFYLRRLAGLIALEADLPNSVAPEDYEWKARLVRKAIYSCFCDCIELQVKEEARGMLQETSKRA